MHSPAPFDAASDLADDETTQAYLAAALEDPNPDVYVAALRDAERARGVTLPADAGARVRFETRAARGDPATALALLDRLDQADQGI